MNKATPPIPPNLPVTKDVSMAFWRKNPLTDVFLQRRTMLLWMALVALGAALLVMAKAMAVTFVFFPGIMVNRWHKRNPFSRTTKDHCSAEFYAEDVLLGIDDGELQREADSVRFDSPSVSFVLAKNPAVEYTLLDAKNPTRVALQIECGGAQQKIIFRADSAEAAKRIQDKLESMMMRPSTQPVILPPSWLPDANQVTHHRLKNHVISDAVLAVGLVVFITYFLVNLAWLTLVPIATGALIIINIVACSISSGRLLGKRRKEQEKVHLPLQSSVLEHSPLNAAPIGSDPMPGMIP